MPQRGAHPLFPLLKTYIPTMQTEQEKEQAELAAEAEAAQAAPENPTTSSQGGAPQADGAATEAANPLDDREPVELGAATDPALEKELEAALAEADKWRDQALRASAEMQNIRQRAERDVEKAHKFGLEKFAESLLPVHDSLAQALAVPVPQGAEEPLKPMREGIELTLKMLVDTLARFNVECIDPAGEPFNPELHEAMTMVENPDCEPNTVIDVFQKGFTLNGRLVRAAKVVVSRAPVQPVNETV